MAQPQKTVVFTALNLFGHTITQMCIANHLKSRYNFRTVFVLFGPTPIKLIEQYGHELVLVCRDNKEGKVTLDTAEERYCRDNDDSLVYQTIIKPDMSPFEQTVNLFYKDGGQTSLQFKQSEEYERNYDKVLRSLKPDLIVTDLWAIPPCLIEQGVPWVYFLSSAPLSVYQCKLEGHQPPPYIGIPLYDKETRLRMQADEPDRWNAILSEWDRISNSFNNNLGYYIEIVTKFAARYAEKGLQYTPLREGPSPYLNVYHFPKEIDYDLDDDLLDRQKNWFRGGVFILNVEESDEQAKYWMEQIKQASIGRKHIVFFSLGTLATMFTDNMRKYIDIFSQDPDNLYVIVKGSRGDEIDLTAPNTIGGNFLPQQFLLKHVDLMICHGGTSTITEGLYNAIPMISMPCFGDHFDNSQRLEDLKLGRKLDLFKPNKEELLGAVKELLTDEALKERLRAVQRSMQSRDDVAKVAMIFNKLAEDKKLDKQFIEEWRDKDFVYESPTDSQ